MTSEDNTFKSIASRVAYGRCNTTEDRMTEYLLQHRLHHIKKHHHGHSQQEEIEMVKIPIYKENRIIGYEWG